MNTSGALGVSECSNSSWAEMESYVIASSSIYPLTLAAKQCLILRYLTPMGEYQEVSLSFLPFDIQSFISHKSVKKFFYEINNEKLSLERKVRPNFLTK